MYSSTKILQVSLRGRGPKSSTKHSTVLHRCYKFQTLALRRGVHRHAYVRRDSFQNRELKNHDDDFVDDDRKWDTVHCATAVNKFRRRGVVDDAKHSTLTSSCNPQASAGITPCF